MGKGAQVYLGSAELAAVCSLLGRIPTVPEYLEIMSKKINPFAGDLYRYLNFDRISGFEDEGRTVSVDDVRKLGPIDRYIVDFYCKDLKLAIEIDGSSHDGEEAKVNDDIRQERLESLGVRFLRFTDADVKQNMDMVVDSIDRWIDESSL